MTELITLLLLLLAALVSVGALVLAPCIMHSCLRPPSLPTLPFLPHPPLLHPPPAAPHRGHASYKARVLAGPRNVLTARSCSVSTEQLCLSRLLPLLNLTLALSVALLTLRTVFQPVTSCRCLLIAVKFDAEGVGTFHPALRKCGSLKLRAGPGMGAEVHRQFTMS